MVFNELGHLRQVKSVTELSFFVLVLVQVLLRLAKNAALLETFRYRLPV